MDGTCQCTLMLKLMAVCIIMISTTTANITSLRDYCDQQVYSKAPDKFGVSPSPYALPYFKRCLNHKEWTQCLVETRETQPNGVTLMSYEKHFPKASDLNDTGDLFCQLHLFVMPPNDECVYNHNSCNKEFGGKDPCSDSVTRVICLWKELKLCKIPNTCPIKAYEFSLLGRDCLDQENIGNLTITEKVAVECVFGRGYLQNEPSGQNVQAQPFMPTGTFILIFLLAYYILSQAMSMTYSLM